VQMTNTDGGHAFDGRSYGTRIMAHGECLQLLTVPWWISAGGCPTANRIYSYFIKEENLPLVCNPPVGELAPYTGPPSDNYMCDGHKVSSNSTPPPPNPLAKSPETSRKEAGACRERPRPLEQRDEIALPHWEQGSLWRGRESIDPACLS